MLCLPLNRLPAGASKLCLAFSGGIDSCVLLQLLLEQTRELDNSFLIELWHINYGVQSNAGDMETLAQSLAERHKLPLIIDHIRLDAHQGNFEARARQARYDLFRERLDASSVLVTGHHMNDQAETLLLNLLRTSSARGLRGMQQLMGFGESWLFRPLLGIERKEIEHYARTHRIDWVDDPSNQSLKHDRNFLRHQIIPRLEQRWPATVPNIARSSQWQLEQQCLLDDLARQDLMSIQTFSEWSDYPCLMIDALNQISVIRRKNLLRFWLHQDHRHPPGFRKLAQLLKQLETTSRGQSMIQLDDCKLRSYSGLLHLVEGSGVVLPRVHYKENVKGEFNIPQLGLKLSRAQMLAAVGQRQQQGLLELRFRQSAGSLPPEYAHRLKRLFQRHRVPPWMRAVTPLVFLRDDLVGLLTPATYSSGV